MQKKITRKLEIRDITEKLIPLYQSGSPAGFLAGIEQEILRHRVKFPLLEYVAHQCSTIIPEDQQLDFLNKMAELEYEGGYVVIAIVLQNRLTDNLAETFEQAGHFIVKADKWYACDIIAERVFGVALLNRFETSFPIICEYTIHNNDWIKRASGIGMHYATKKGLKQDAVEQLLQLILAKGNGCSLFPKKGFGWALKTMARFHPQMMKAYLPQIVNNPEVDLWYKAKIRMGLNRADR